MARGASTQSGDSFEATVRVESPATFGERLRAELAVQSITKESVERVWVPLCKDPQIYVRDATDPVGYRRSAEHVASLMREIGLDPLGDTEDGKQSYLQSFWWRPTWGADKRPVQTWNVVGCLRGTPREDGRPNDVLVVEGHLDNLSQAEKDWYKGDDGRDLSHYEGASDNASAVTAVLEIARALRACGKLKYDIVFLVPSGEEDGMKGSQAFVMSGAIPPERIRGVINFEMLGFDKHLLYGGIDGDEEARNALLERARRVAQESGASVVPGLSFDEGEHWWRRSDHYPFHLNGIPSIMILGQPPSGLYHYGTDDVAHSDAARIRDGAQLAMRILLDFDRDPSPGERRRPNWYGSSWYDVWPGTAPPFGARRPSQLDSFQQR